MPCYLFTYHAYQSWMPDRPQGYVKRHEGILPTDHEAAKFYRKLARYAEIEFDAEHQSMIVATVREAVTHIECQLHFVSTDSTHVHALVSWNCQRSWEQNRTSIKRSITIALKNQFGDRPWLSEGASRKRVRDQKHFDYLMTQYLPKHDGWKWREEFGLFR